MQEGSGGAFLEGAVLGAGLLGGAGLTTAVELGYDRRPALLAVRQVVQPVRQQLPRYQPVLAPRPRRLRLHHDPRRLVLQLYRAVCFVLFGGVGEGVLVVRGQ